MRRGSLSAARSTINREIRLRARRYASSTRTARLRACTRARTARSTDKGAGLPRPRMSAFGMRAGPWTCSPRSRRPTEAHAAHAIAPEAVAPYRPSIFRKYRDGERTSHARSGATKAIRRRRDAAAVRPCARGRSRLCCSQTSLTASTLHDAASEGPSRCRPRPADPLLAGPYAPGAASRNGARCRAARAS